MKRGFLVSVRGILVAASLVMMARVADAEPQVISYSSAGIRVGDVQRFTGDVDDVAFDGAQDLLWFASGRSLNVIDLRDATLAPTEIAKGRPGHHGFAIVDAIAMMASFRDQMCQCVDKVCADRVTEKMTKWGRSLAREGADHAIPINEDDTYRALSVSTATVPAAHE